MFHDDGQILRVTLVGAWPDHDQTHLARQHARSSGLWRSDRPVLMDLRHVQIAGTPPFAEMRRRTEAWKLLVTPPPRIAFLASRASSYGFARMLEQQWMSDQVATFEHEMAARVWLLAGA